MPPMDTDAHPGAEALLALRRYFGYPSFRPGQDRMVAAILDGRDAMGVMPTGAGKSICYQVPSLVLPGLTLVVSPLVSLMADQVRSLKAAGARPSYLNSTLTIPQQNTVMKRAREGWYQIMYVAPERLGDPRFRAFAREVMETQGIPLVAVDEAHCISQWGQDFRPAYLDIASFINELPHRPVVAAFTATATERVRADIVELLDLHDPVSVVTGFDRANLFFGVEELGEREKARRIRDYVLEHVRESGIVYCSTRKATDTLAAELADALAPAGVRVGRYHAGMSPEERARNQEAFIDDELAVIVATNAFGMGIDKPNVRYVIHHNVPESIEAYYQEAGRAGRDGDPATCLLLWNGRDFHTRRYLIDRTEEDAALSEEQAEQARQNRYRLLAAMEGYCETTGCLRAYLLRYFGDEDALGVERTAEGGCGACSNCTEASAVEDVTEIARAAVQFVRETGGRFGKALVAEALHGSQNERVMRYRLDEAAGFATLGLEPIARIKTVLGQLVGRGYLEQTPGRFPVLVLGPRAAEVLDEDEAHPFQLTVKQRGTGRAAGRSLRAVDLIRAESGQAKRDRVGDDAELFERLRVVRHDLATERGWAPYMVCADKSLRGLCRQRPQTREELLEVTGFGEKKVADFGDTFLEAIARFEEEAREEG